jgi:hypothetical protein
MLNLLLFGRNYFGVVRLATASGGARSLSFFALTSDLLPHFLHARPPEVMT